MRAVAALLLLFLLPVAAHAGERPAFILIHGAWGSGQGWWQVRPLLEKAGYRVFAPSLTGQGERAREGGPAVNLATHIDDIVRLIETRRLHRVILVGHSYGGMVVSGVAERVPERIARVIYVDAFLPKDGESAFSQMVPSFVASLRKRALEQGDGWAIPSGSGKGPPQPIGTLEQALTINNPRAAAIPGTYILTMDPGAAMDAFSFAAHRAQLKTWPVYVLRTGHLPQVTMPGPLAQLLIDAALITPAITGP